MMQEVVLYLENPDGDIHEIPIFDGYNVSLNFSFADVESFKSTGTFSSTFRCPIDEEFQNFIGAVYDVNYVGWFDSKTKIPAYITVNTLPFSQGHIQVMSFFSTKTGWEVDLQYYGETPNIKTALGDLKLKDLSQLNDPTFALNHTLSYDNITDDNLLSGNVNYFLIDKGQNFSENGEVGTRPIFNASQELQAIDFTPAVKARYIWDEIWSDAGFTIESPSDFPDVLDNYWIPWYNGTIAPLDAAGDDDGLFAAYLDTSDEIVLTAPFSTNGNAQITTWTEQFDNGGNLVGNVYTVPYDGLFQIFTRATFTRSDSSGFMGVRIGLSRNGVALTETPNTYIYNTEPVTLERSFTLNLNAGDVIRSYYAARSWTAPDDETLTIEGTADLDYENGTSFECTLADRDFGYTVDMIRNAPDMRQFDFISSIVRMHNLVLVPDRNVPNKIRVEAMNDYLQSGNTVDWTGKIDRNKDIIIKPTNEIQKRDLEFTYSKDGDALNKIYNDQQDRNYGSLTTKDSGILTNLQSDFATGTLKVESKFSPTPCNAIPGTSLPIPKFINDSGGTFKAKPRILYHAYNFSGVQVYDEDADAVTPTEVRVLSHFDNYDVGSQEPGVDTLDLNFGAELFPSGYIQTTFGAPKFNLFYRYWQDYIREIYDPTARMMVAYFALDITDVLTFGFNDVVFIKDSYWRILKIEGYGVGLNNVTKVTLLKILSLGAECEFTPFSSNADGTVTMEAADGTTGAGSQECCERYGYNWVDGACYWSLDEGEFKVNTQGLNNWGYGKGNARTLPTDAISFVANSDIQGTNFGSRYGGYDITSGVGNPGSIMQGQILSMSDELGSAAVFGENADVTMFGQHFGGGGDFEVTQGRAQIGTIVLYGEGTLASNGDSFEIFLKGDERLSIPDNSVWAVDAEVSFGHYNVATGNLDTWGQQVYYFEIHKAGATAGTTSAQYSPDHEDGNLKSHIELAVDTATDTTQHRFSIKAVSGTSLPSADLKVTMKIEYTQILDP